MLICAYCGRSFSSSDGHVCQVPTSATASDLAQVIRDLTNDRDKWSKERQEMAGVIHRMCDARDQQARDIVKMTAEHAATIARLDEDLARERAEHKANVEMVANAGKDRIAELEDALDNATKRLDNATKRLVDAGVGFTGELKVNRLTRERDAARQHAADMERGNKYLTERRDELAHTVGKIREVLG